MDGKHQVLQEYFGYDAFRPGQGELIDALLAGRDAFGVMPTGGGKSLCYQVPALLLPGVTVVVSPLISLMQDQVTALKKAGVAAAYLNSALTQAQIDQVCRRLLAGEYRLLYVAPERLLADRFLAVVQRLDIAMVAVDEAHCISQWGQDFRPSYLEIQDFLASLPRRPVVTAFTATATQAVRQDIVRSLGLRNPQTFVTGFDRPNLYFEVQQPSNRNQAVLDTLARFPGRSGIIYCLTRKNVESLCELLQEKGFFATRYHAGLDPQERQENQEDFLYDQKQIMVATNAFGMGIDKSNVSFVIHCGMPGNPESYYQEAGRAGRDGGPAQCILLFQQKDIATNRYFIEHSEGDDPALTPEQAEALRKQSLHRLRQMSSYCTAPGCLRKKLLGYFGEQAPDRCGNCSNCLSGQPPEDATALGRQFILCIALLARENRAFGAEAIIKILRGVDDPALEWLRPRRLDCFGSLSAQPAKKLRQVSAALIDQGYVRQTEGQWPVLELTEQAPGLVTKSDHLWIKPLPDRRKARAALPRGEADGALLVKLKEVRSALARQAGVPAFMIFSDATLQDMCRLVPRTREEFLEVKGVGNVKAQRYGKAFLAVLSQWEGPEQAEGR